MPDQITGARAAAPAFSQGEGTGIQKVNIKNN